MALESNTAATITLSQRFFSTCATQPEKVALVFEGAGLTYGELGERVLTCAEQYKRDGCARGDSIALILPNGFDFVVAFFASFAVGAAITPLNPEYSHTEISEYLRRCSPKVVVVERQSELHSVLPDCGARIWHGIPEQETQPTELKSGALGSVTLFSSGTTGEAKQVTRSETRMLAEFEAVTRTMDISSAAVIGLAAPMYHAYAIGNALLPGILSGAQLQIASRQLSPRRLLKQLFESGATHFFSVPAIFQALARTKLPGLDLSCMRYIVSAGAPLAAETYDKFLQQHGGSIRGLYGSSETGVIAFNRDAIVEPSSVGRPIHASKLRIQDECARSLAPSEIGEIWVQTAGMVDGYDKPEQTAEQFRDGWYKSGDIGYLDESGKLFITGRTSSIINVSGYKVDPNEVERVLSQHQLVDDCVVVAHNREPYGEVVRAIVVLSDKGNNRDVARTLLSEHCAHGLAEYKRPKLIEFRDQLERNAMGKVPKQSL